MKYPTILKSDMSNAVVKFFKPGSGILVKGSSIGTYHKGDYSSGWNMQRFCIIYNGDDYDELMSMQPRKCRSCKNKQCNKCFIYK